ncbi:MAG: hypothetical protein Q9217_003686 [Psora testacea]
MSISSMLGTDPPKTREPSAPALINCPPPNHPYLSSALHASTGSPTKRQYGNTSRKQSSPETQGSMLGSSNRFRTYSGGAPQSARTSIKPESPMNTKFGRLPGDNLSQTSPRSDHGAPQDWRGRHDKYSEPGRSLERPSSQPSGAHVRIEDINRKAMEINGRQSDINRDRSARQEFDPGPERSFSSLIEPLMPQSQTNGQSRPQQAPQNARQHSPPDDRMHVLNYPFLSSSSVFTEPTNNVPRPESNPSHLHGQRQQNTQKGPWGAEALRKIRDERLGTTSVQQHRPPASDSRPGFLDTRDDRKQKQQPEDVKYAPATLELQRSESLDRAIQQTRTGEDGHRNSLALMLEHNRRAGRASPLPQAVQGAQGKTNGPSRDPSIKNEFSKMFAGIGSGVSSSGLAGSGTSTPFAPPSPKQSEGEQRFPFGNRNDLLEITKSRNGSRMGNKRSRKVKDHDVNETDRVSRVDAGKGTKRVRHHHHAPGHHHHHHYRIDEQTGTPIRVIGDPAATNHHHHHHPDGTIHYHMHGKPTSAATQSKLLAPPRIPKSTINNASLLARISHLPRRHLGSVLYAPTLEPATSSSSLSSSLPYTNGQYTIPPCPGKENCTLTVRIPRFYLTSSEREAICHRRAVWGSDVYTDDSDPLAAAIHSGWVRGEWGDGVDASTLEIERREEISIDSEHSSFTSPPASPVLPPHDKDLHLALLILPPLKGYASIMAHGVKSRSWGRDHDGMSFKIDSMSWVDGGVAAGEERGGKAKKARIRGLMSASMEAAVEMGMGPAVKLALGRKRSEVQAAA